MKSKILKTFFSSFLFPTQFAMGLPQFARESGREKKTLRFGKDGKFKILHLTDIHLVDPSMDDDEDREIPEFKFVETINVIEKCVEQTNPDLVVFGGDNISGFWDEFNFDLVRKTIEKIVEPIKKRNIPLAIVFGNHDSEAGWYREVQMCFYLEYENFLGNFNDEDVYGCGNYNLTVKRSDSDEDAFSIWLMDSNDYVRDEEGCKDVKAYTKGKNGYMVNEKGQNAGYDYVHPDQIAWYEKRAAQLKEKNGGEPLPAILFQHMPVRQEFDLLKEVDETGENTIGSGDKFLTFGENLITGQLREMPCPPSNPERREQFESWKKTGDIVEAFFGHDHVNTFTVELDGIKLTQTIAAGFFTYGYERGGRLITIDENNPRDVKSETIVIPRITDKKL